jgi:hypothetical protein
MFRTLEAKRHIQNATHSFSANLPCKKGDLRIHTLSKILPAKQPRTMPENHTAKLLGQRSAIT